MFNLFEHIYPEMKINNLLIKMSILTLMINWLMHIYPKFKIKKRKTVSITNGMLNWLIHWNTYFERGKTLSSSKYKITLELK
jgi:hypothetical protein